MIFLAAETHSLISELVPKFKLSASFCSIFSVLFSVPKNFDVDNFYISAEQVNASPSLKKTFAGSEESDVKLSYAMMLMWSNFAKSGWVPPHLQYTCVLRIYDYQSMWNAF